MRLVLLLVQDEETDGDGPESVEWLFSRSLLTEGLLAPAGQGDVQVRVDGHDVSIELARSAEVLLPLAGMVEFLADSDEVVPTGAETLAGSSLDEELARLLG